MAITLLLTSLWAGLAQGSYSVHDLGDLGGNHSVVYAINDAGHATGFSLTQWGGDKAYFWDGTTMQNLGTWGESSWGHDLNWKDEVVGTWEYGFRGFLWSGGSLTKIEPGQSSSTATSINAKSFLSGSADIPGSPLPEMRAFLRHPDGTIDLLDPAGGTHSQALGGIQVDGTVCGYSSAGGSAPRQAAIWPAGQAAQLLGGLHPSYSSRGYGINDSGAVVGDAFVSATEVAAFRWTQAAGMVQLPTPAHLPDFATARDLNVDGTVVGYALDQNLDPPSRAIRWNSQNQVIDLNQLIPAGSGWTLKKAYAINSLGEIGCAAEFQGNTHAVILRPDLNDPILGELCLPEAGQLTAVFGLGFTPHQRVALLASTTLGSFSYAGCPSLMLDLNNPRLVASTNADADGRVRFDFPIPLQMSGVQVFGQAFEPTGCRKTEVREYQIR